MYYAHSSGIKFYARSLGGDTYFGYLHILTTLHLITLTLLSKLNVTYVLYVYLVYNLFLDMRDKQRMTQVHLMKTPVLISYI